MLTSPTKGLPLQRSLEVRNGWQYFIRMAIFTADTLNHIKDITNKGFDILDADADGRPFIHKILLTSEVREVLLILSALSNDTDRPLF